MVVSIVVAFTKPPLSVGFSITVFSVFMPTLFRPPVPFWTLSRCDIPYIYVPLPIQYSDLTTIPAKKPQSSTTATQSPPPRRYKKSFRFASFLFLLSHPGLASPSTSVTLPNTIAPQHDKYYFYLQYTIAPAIRPNEFVHWSFFSRLCRTLWRTVRLHPYSTLQYAQCFHPLLPKLTPLPIQGAPHYQATWHDFHVSSILSHSHTAQSTLLSPHRIRMTRTSPFHASCHIASVAASHASQSTGAIRYKAVPALGIRTYGTLCTPRKK